MYCGRREDVVVGLVLPELLAAVAVHGEENCRPAARSTVSRPRPRARSLPALLSCAPRSGPPVASSRATTRRSPVVRYTVPSTTAGDENKGPSVSKRHFSLPEGTAWSSATRPECRWSRWNIGQLPGVDAALTLVDAGPWKARGPYVQEREPRHHEQHDAGHNAVANPSAPPPHRKQPVDDACGLILAHHRRAAQPRPALAASRGTRVIGMRTVRAYDYAALSCLLVLCHGLHSPVERRLMRPSGTNLVSSLQIVNPSRSVRRWKPCSSGESAARPGVRQPAPGPRSPRRW